MAVMEIHRCTVFGKVWQTADRPGKLSEGDNRMVSSVTDNYFNPDSETVRPSPGLLNSQPKTLIAKDSECITSLPPCPSCKAFVKVPRQTRLVSLGSWPRTLCRAQVSENPRPHVSVNQALRDPTASLNPPTARIVSDVSVHEALRESPRFNHALNPPCMRSQAENLYTDVHQTPLDMPIPTTPRRNPSPDKMPPAAPIDPKPLSPQPQPYNIQRKRSVPDLRAEMFALSSDAFPASSPPSRPSPQPPTSNQPAPGRTLSPFRTESTFPSPSPHSEAFLQTPAPVAVGKGSQPQSNDADGGMPPSRIDGLQSQSNAHAAPTEGYDVGHSPAPPSRSASPNGGDLPEAETLSSASSLQARQSLAEPPASPPPNLNETKD